MDYFNKFHRDPGLVVGFSFRVREIPGSIPGDPPLFIKKLFLLEVGLYFRTHEV